MDWQGIVITASSAVYEVGGLSFEADSPGFPEAVAEAHAGHRRPRCMCQAEGVEMYVARLGGGYIVKRMPESGSQHAPGCPSYEPPAEFSGLGQLLGSAITEDPATGETSLKLDFSLTKIGGRAAMPPARGDGDTASSSGAKLSLRGLLHYLWDQAELTRWHPGFAGKRTWATVRRHLLQAADHKMARGENLLDRLYVPEPFSVEERAAIDARRLSLWQRATASPGKPQQLMLVIGEVKEIVPARYGFKAVIKHIPDQSLAIDEKLYQRLERRFEPQLGLWGAADDIHMIMIATFGVSSAGVPVIHELSMMPVTRQWLPVDDGFEKQLVDRLVGENRSFVKGLHYNLARRDRVASATLIDCGDCARTLFIVPVDLEGSVTDRDSTNSSAHAWVWHRFAEPMPALPSRAASPRPARPEG